MDRIYRIRQGMGGRYALERDGGLYWLEGHVFGDYHCGMLIEEAGLRFAPPVVPSKILAIGLNLTLGYAGQISLCHAAFMGFGSYAVAILGARGVPFEVGLAVGVAVAFLWGLVLGFPALKVKHHYLAMVVELNPVSKELLAEMRRWLTRPAGSASIDRGSSFFGSFVSVFVNPRLPEAERVLRVRSQPFYRLPE